MLPVFDERHCIGHLLRRGSGKVEAFDASDQPLGLFETEDKAAAAVWRCAHKQIEPVAPVDERIRHAENG
jgi:hypothetical protein